MGRCPECGTELTKVTNGSLPWHSQTLGYCKVDNVDFDFCSHCVAEGDDMAYSLPLETCNAIDSKLDEILSKWLKEQPLQDFLTEEDVLIKLNMTLEELKKNKTIERGIIYHISIDEHTYYHRKSVELYLNSEKGDGRFIISQPPPLPIW